MTSPSDLRCRKPSKLSSVSPPSSAFKYSSSRRPLRAPSFLVPFAFIFVVPFLLTYATFHIYNARLALPSPQSQTSPFSLPRTMQHVNVLAAKSRAVNTLALDKSVQYLLTELQSLQPNAMAAGLNLDIDVFQSSPGTFSIALGHFPFVNSYDNLTSVVVRLRPSADDLASVESLLVNAHIDSAIGSPGANDNIAGVSLALDIVRCLVEHHHKYGIVRPIVFLFNGAEEVILSGAHSFVTQHPWAQSIVAHINLESLGSGDYYHLFRLGPNNPWLAHAYARAVSVPSSSVVGTDIFETKLIPAETDFRIFEEVANIPGYDFVLLDNGYIYHTIYDSVEKVSPKGVFHGGTCILELINELAGQNDAIGSHLLTKNAKPPHRMQALFRRLTIYLGLKKDTQDVTVTFFDLFGIVLVVYEEGFAALLNVVIPLITVFIWGSRLRTILVPDFRVILRMCLVMVACILGAFASSTFTSLMYAYGLKKNLVWYGSSLRATLLYGPPALFGAVSMLLFLLPKGLSVHRFDQMLFAITLFSFVASIVLTKFGIRSSYIPLALLVISDICALQGASVHPLIRHAEIMFVHIVIGAKMSSVALSVMLPLLGRAASKVSHDAIAAGLITLFGIPVFILPSLPILCHYAGYLRKIRGFTYLMCIVSGVWFIVISPKRAGELSGFPYSTDAPKRLAFIHFYSPQQSPPTVLWMATLDPIAPDTKRLLSKLPDADIDIGSIDSLPQWGSMNSTALESFRGMQFVFQERLFFRSGERPRLPIPIVSILSEEEVESGWNISVLIKASQSHMITARIPTDETSPVKAWSFNVTMNDYPDDIWIKHSGSDEFVFWLILNKQLETKSIRPTVKMAVTSSRMGASRSPTDLQKLVFAEWEAPVLLVSTGIEVEL